MGYVSRELKIPDDVPWVALVAIDPEGETDILGYVDLHVWERFIHTAELLHSQFVSWVNSDHVVGPNTHN